MRICHNQKSFIHHWFTIQWFTIVLTTLGVRLKVMDGHPNDCSFTSTHHWFGYNQAISIIIIHEFLSRTMLGAWTWLVHINMWLPGNWMESGMKYPWTPPFNDTSTWNFWRPRSKTLGAFWKFETCRSVVWLNGLSPNHPKMVITGNDRGSGCHVVPPFLNAHAEAKTEIASVRWSPKTETQKHVCKLFAKEIPFSIGEKKQMNLIQFPKHGTDDA